ncbi:MAG: hypothetical protein PHU25_17225 [Deltaproteobacteria bacterium]|nr:hypothetical protein [Deltaproteobacteria bacterium]
MTQNKTSAKVIFELRALSAATTRLALLDYFFGETKQAATVRQRGFTTGDLGDYLNQARHEIGLPALSGPGAEQGYLKRHVVDEDASDGIDRAFVADNAQRTTERSTKRFKPEVKAWGDIWRFLYSPSHRDVRLNANGGQLAPHPAPLACEGVAVYRFTPSSSTLPVLDVHHVRDVGAVRKHLADYAAYRYPKRPRPDDTAPDEHRDMTDEYFTRVASPQIYLLIFEPGEEGAAPTLQTYVGQTTEPEVRLAHHEAGYHCAKKRIHDAFLVFPAPHEGDLSSVEQDIAESMVINFFREISDNDNKVGGGDSLPPQMAAMRRAAGFATAFCAAVMQLVKDKKIDLPFHKEITDLLKHTGEAPVERYLAGGAPS